MSISGPFVKETRFPSSGVYPAELYTYVWGYRQTKPYIFPSPLRSISCRSRKVTNPNVDTLVSASSFEFDPHMSPVANVAHALCYEKFRDMVGEQVNILVDLAERKQTIDMIAKRGSQLLRFAKAVRSFRFVDAAKELGLKVVSRKDSRYVTKLKTSLHGDLHELRLMKNANRFGSNFLEYHFGLEPLIGDVHALIQKCYAHDVNGRRKVVVARKRATYLDPEPTMNNGNVRVQISWDTHVRMSAIVLVDSSNASTLNQLGFLNPLVLAWNVIPFSFVVDWFANVESVLGAYTDFAGVTLQKPQTTIFSEIDVANWSKEYGLQSIYCTRKVYAVQRRTSIDAPPLVLRPLKLPSITRALTSMSLLTQFLGKR